MVDYVVLKPKTITEIMTMPHADLQEYAMQQHAEIRALRGNLELAERYLAQYERPKDATDH